MLKYIVVTNCYIDKFKKEVNDHLKSGWSLSGSLATAQDADDDVLFSQAMVKARD